MTDTVPFYLISSSFGQNELINKRKNSNYIETRQREVPFWKAISGERGMGVNKSLYWGKIDQVQLRGVPLYTRLGQRWWQHLSPSAPSLQTRHSPQPSSSWSVIIKPLQDKDCLHCLLLFYYFIFLYGKVIVFLCHLVWSFHNEKVKVRNRCARNLWHVVFLIPKLVPFLRDREVNSSFLSPFSSSPEK